ncbi:transposase [Streptomyces sp. NBC_00094]|uniref:transposase n=1 Tax=Streptomyces sp. NBC_00094 TaxID=2903620 RepID=UPI00338DCBD3
MTSLAKPLVPDELCKFFRRVVPETVVVRPQGGGRRRAGDRECLAAIVFVATSGCTRRHVPPLFGPAWPTVYRRFARWSKDRVWARLHRVILDELGAQGDLDWSRFAIGSVSSFRVATDRVTGQRPATHEAPVPLREVFDVSTHQRRSLVGSLSCRTRPASCSGRVGIHAHRHP